MPSGKPVDWSLYDNLIIEHLPHMIINEFTSKYLRHVSPKAVGARARKLGVKPAKRTLTAEQRVAISMAMRTETPEIVEQIKSLRQTHSIKQICAELNIDDATLWRIINRHNIVLTVDGRMRARAASISASVGKKPWNKDGHLSEETKHKISVAVSGELNGQHGRGMTEEEKERWRISYYSCGVHKMREYIRSPAGLLSLAKTIATTTSQEFRAAARERAFSSEAVQRAIDKNKLPENRAAMSEMMAKLLADGRIKPHSNHKHGYHHSPKCGRVYYRSSYELRYFQILDNDEYVISYHVEPFSIKYRFDGTILSYTPDVLIFYKHKVVLIEIKPKYWLTSDKNQAKITAGQSYCSDHGIEFAIITEDDL